MTKRNLLLASLLLVLGLGIMAPFASAQVEGNGTVFNVYALVVHVAAQQHWRRGRTGIY